MKATALQSFLDECRAADTSDAIGEVIDQIEQKIGTMHADRAKLDGQLQEVIVAGRDSARIYTAIAQLDQDVMTLEAARAGFSQKQADVRKREAEAAKRSLLDRHAAETQQVADQGKKLRAAADEFWRLAAEGEKLVRQHDRTVGELESLGERRLQRASAVLRDNIGPRPAPSSAMNLSEYGKQVFTLLSQILALNPANLMRARLSRRQGGRFGESFQAKDHATDAFMDQVRNARAG